MKSKLKIVLNMDETYQWNTSSFTALLGYMYSIADGFTYDYHTRGELWDLKVTNKTRVDQQGIIHEFGLSE